MDAYEQLSLFPEENIIPALVQEPEPRSVTWNLWFGCTPVSEGCRNCYMYRRAREYGMDPTTIRKTQAFSLPVRKYRTGQYKGLYKIPSGSTIYTCFSSDFFHKDADEWRPEAWAMIKERSDCTFFMITKRPARIEQCLPPDWGTGYGNVHISVTCENQITANHRLPGFLTLPMAHHSITLEPLLGPVNLRPFFERYHLTIEEVSVGGESGPEARICDYAWVLDIYRQCVEYGIPFHYHQTGARLLKDGKVYQIRRVHQHEQAKKAGLDYDG